MTWIPGGSSIEIVWVQISLRFQLQFLSFNMFLGGRLEFHFQFNGNSKEISMESLKNPREITQKFYGSYIWHRSSIALRFTWIQSCNSMEVKIKLMCNIRPRYWYLVLLPFDRFYMEDPYKMPFHWYSTNVEFPLNFYRISMQSCVISMEFIEKFRENFLGISIEMGVNFQSTTVEFRPQ